MCKYCTSWKQDFQERERGCTQIRHFFIHSSFVDSAIKMSTTQQKGFNTTLYHVLNNHTKGSKDYNVSHTRHWMPVNPTHRVSTGAGQWHKWHSPTCDDLCKFKGWIESPSAIFIVQYVLDSHGLFNVHLSSNVIPKKGKTLTSGNSEKLFPAQMGNSCLCHLIRHLKGSIWHSKLHGEQLYLWNTSHLGFEYLFLSSSNIASRHCLMCYST